jgi:pimeloyl-ACP methyl ester carboxylesterase
MRHTIIESGKFRFIEEGQGEPIILLHGLFGALSNFKEVLEHFSRRYTVYIPMLPIYTLPVLNTNVKSIASFLHDFIRFKGLTRVNLLGNSLGGHVALVYVKEHPEMVRSLVLTGSSGLYENAFGASFPRREDKEFIRKKVELTFFDPVHATDELVEECYTIVNDRNKLLRILAIAKSAIRHNMAKDLGSMTLPVCLIWGKNDTITPPEVADEFNRLLPNSDLFWINNCGHAPMMEHPGEFISILDAWLNQRGIA